MTRDSKREIERRIDDLDSEQNPKQRLKEVWEAELRGEEVAISDEEFTALIKAV